LIANLPNDLML